MEQRNIFSPGQRGLSAEDILDRLAQAPPPGRRRAPQGPEGAGIRPRGDHDLNPEFYDPKRKLVAAAVLVPIVVHKTGLTVLFTRRTEHLDAHAGQISFPGGQIEPGDAGPQAAALRETEEEVGLPRRCVRLIGALDTYVTRTGFEVTPVVGLVTPPFKLTLDTFEVAEAFEAPLSFFLAPESLKQHSRVYDGKERHFYVFPYGDYFIWGATAGMLVNLTEILTADRDGA
jgi:8-oxo-dGTP pyrophosphatase MutT (NUDIX family)